MHVLIKQYKFALEIKWHASHHGTFSIFIYLLAFCIGMPYFMQFFVHLSDFFVQRHIYVK